MGKTVITYGTYDLLHLGHINLLRRAKALGDCLIVGLSTDEFNIMKHKDSFFDYNHRKMILESMKFVDIVIPEETWEQKISDIKKYKVDIFVMCDDWKGQFDNLKDFCEVLYLKRTPNISSSLLKVNISNKVHSSSKRKSKS